MRAALFVAVVALAGCQAAAEPDALFVAVAGGDARVLAGLLEQGRGPDLRDQCGWTPLMHSAQAGHRELAALLLDAGADPEATDKGGYSALMLAAGSNRLGLVRDLLAAGARIDRIEHTRGWTALIWAAAEGHAGVVELLLEQGADRAIRDHQGMCAADRARERGWVALSRHLE